MTDPASLYFLSGTQPTKVLPPVKVPIYSVDSKTKVRVCASYRAGWGNKGNATRVKQEKPTSGNVRNKREKKFGQLGLFSCSTPPESPDVIEKRVPHSHELDETVFVLRHWADVLNWRRLASLSIMKRSFQGADGPDTKRFVCLGTNPAKNSAGRSFDRKCLSILRPCVILEESISLLDYFHDKFRAWI